MDAIRLVHLEKLGRKRDDLRKDSCKFYITDGRERVFLGKIEATLRIQDAALDIKVHLYEGLTDALLSKSSLVELKLLPQDWPSRYSRHEPSRWTRPEMTKIRSDLLHELSNVFNSTQLKPMTGPLMDIRLHPDASPASAHHARPIPYSFRQQVKVQLDDMVANEIIGMASPDSDCEQTWHQ